MFSRNGDKKTKESFMQWNASWAMMAILFIFTGCGKAFQVSDAPTNQHFAGIIATCTTTTEALQLAKELDGQFRVLSEEKKLIEFIGIEQKDLEKKLKRSRFIKNIVYDGLIETSSQASAQFVDASPFTGPGTPIYRNEISYYDFPHLAQIEAPAVPGKIAGDGVVIAIVDSGVAYNHPDLNPNILTDNLGNMIGKNFITASAAPFDDNGHGTHVAGLAAGTRSGVAPRSKILPVKVLNSQGRGDIGTIAAGILYAIDQGADIINLSLGGPAAEMMQYEVSRLLSTIKMAKTKDRLIIAAAGNGGRDELGDCNDEQPVFPASFQEESLISVAAVDSYNNLTSYSNYGKVTVDITAPGGNGGYWGGGLFSTSNTGGYVEMSGTSMATPLVSGLAALIKSANPNLTSTDIKNIIFQTGESKRGLQDYIATGKVINVQNALDLFR